MKEIWSKFKFSIVIAGYVIFVVVFMYFLAMPLISNIRALAYQIQAKAIDREIEKSKIEKLPELTKEWSEYEEREEMLNVILSQQDQVSFIENIETIAQASGNKVELKIEENVKDVAASAKNKKLAEGFPYPDFLVIQIDLTGGYAGLVKFIHLLENSQFYVNVISFSSVKNTAKNEGNSNPFTKGEPGDTGESSAEEGDSIKTSMTAVVYIKKL